MATTPVEYEDNRKQHHHYRRVLPTCELRGNRVRNAAGNHLGKMEEIVVDLPAGRIAYAVLSFGGFLSAKKLFAVPWQALIFDELHHEFILDVDRVVLEDAPGFDPDHWPDMANPNWGKQIHTHYGYEPYWSESNWHPLGREHENRALDEDEQEKANRHR